MQAEETPCISDFGAKSSPSLHSCDILCSVWPVPAEPSVCAHGSYPLFASHYGTSATRVSHPTRYQSLFQNALSFPSEPHGCRIEYNWPGSKNRKNKHQPSYHFVELLYIFWSKTESTFLSPKNQRIWRCSQIRQFSITHSSLASKAFPLLWLVVGQLQCKTFRDNLGLKRPRCSNPHLNSHT